MSTNEAAEPYYVLNRTDGIDTLHRDPIEECRVDDSEGRETIDATTALRMKLGGYARLCSCCSIGEST